jgi:hypothetical protein
MRHLTKIIASAAAVILSGVALAGPSAAPASASGLEGFVLFNYKSVTLGDYFLYAHAHNYPVSTTNSADQAQDWQFINRDDVLNLSNQTETAWEMQLVGTDECLNSVQVTASLSQVYLDSCQAGDYNELFWQVPVAGSPSVYYYRNVAASYGMPGNVYSYMTADGNPGHVYGEGPGGGLYAQWFRACAANCPPA